MEIDLNPDPADMKFGASKDEVLGVTRLSFMNLVDLAGGCGVLSKISLLCYYTFNFFQDLNVKRAPMLQAKL